MTRVVAIIPSIYDPRRTIESLNAQTLPPTRICLADKRFPSQFHGLRVAKAVNSELASLNLDDYDWLLRLDDDTTIPTNFLQVNTAIEADIIGNGGNCLLIRTCVLKKLGGWPELPGEDSSLVYQGIMNGFKHESLVVKDTCQRTVGTYYTWRLFFDSGKELWKLGYTLPFAWIQFCHFLRASGNLGFVLWFAGYLCESIKRGRRYPTWMFIHQLQAQALRDFFGEHM